MEVAKITPDELMRGNLVGILPTALHADGGKDHIFEIEELKKDVVQFKGFHAGEYYKDLCAIPITEEWLIKLGFVKSTSQILYFLPVPMLHFEIHAVKFRKEYVIEIANDVRPIVTEAKYIHHIQNLYRALTQQPLTIKK